jgi:hypothetical protein
LDPDDKEHLPSFGFYVYLETKVIAQDPVWKYLIIILETTYEPKL